MKAVSWRICATAATFTLVYWLTGEWTIAASVGGLEAVAKMILYFVHERFWAKIPPKFTTAGDASGEAVPARERAPVTETPQPEPCGR
nr:DUF2061 domain-containing protein [Acanthopleuribacter pedis]